MVKVIFLHPDLGIGGAEKAVVDAALALESRGHETHFVTAHHDPNHCFPETRDGTLTVTVAGDWIPRSVCGKFYALFAYLRMIYAALYLVIFSQLDFDVVICDQISACVPFLKLAGKPIIFYCHFPDMLLTQRKTIWKKLYRYPIDSLEEYTTGLANCVAVNSRFTAGVFRDTFKSLSTVEPEVIYPIPNFDALDQPIAPMNPDWGIPNTKAIFLSINRYERKKNLSLALTALGKLRDTLGDMSEKVHLIMAGGYDERVQENREYYLELRKLAKDLHIEEHVTFLRSFSDAEKRSLLSAATCLLYTPDREHFGIVPVEAMYMKCPVIAVSSGGPLETICDKVTGYLCEQNEDDFSKAMQKFLDNGELSKQLGESGKARVVKLFSFNTYTNELCNLVTRLCNN